MAVPAGSWSVIGLTRVGSERGLLWKLPAIVRWSRVRKTMARISAFAEPLVPALADEPADAVIACRGAAPAAAFFVSDAADIYRTHLL